MNVGDELNLSTLSEYYEALPQTDAAMAACRMPFPAGFQGKRVLDVNCRRGKGVLGIADRVAPGGTVLGTDPLAQNVEAARKAADEAGARGTITPGAASFVQAVPENLAEAGVAEASFDCVFCNCSLNLMYGIDAALGEMGRALVPGGTLVLDAVVALQPRDWEVLGPARVIGNAVQAAPYQGDLREALEAAGFSEVTMERGEALDHRAAAPGGVAVPVVDAFEDVDFVRCMVTARKA
ncbi:class I SAM-dependent methyltransferase [Eggerthellaceae bacterium zg-997]|nr:class I SAM-dependent methyltransferase [Eggerthellaceae bacterium zg-997]